jgi:sugar phosphate isomerase/epimerase
MSRHLTRRSFLKSSGLLASGLPLANLPLPKGRAQPNERSETAPFGLQLFTLRGVIANDPEGVLRQVADFGYRHIESYEGPQGMFWGMGNTGFKRFLDDHGMTLVSSHADVFSDYEEKVEQAAEIGMEYIVCPSIGRRSAPDAYREMADTFNELGRIANNAGVKFAYHNHDYTFRELDGEFPQDILMQRTDPGLVEFQVDIYWVEIAGQDTREWIQRYPGRFTSSHVKDMAAGDRPESTVLGAGVIDLPSILRLAKEDGMRYFFVEQEAYTGTTPVDAVRVNAEYMRRQVI